MQSLVNLFFGGYWSKQPFWFFMEKFNILNRGTNNHEINKAQLIALSTMNRFMKKYNVKMEKGIQNIILKYYYPCNKYEYVYGISYVGYKSCTIFEFSNVYIIVECGNIERKQSLNILIKYINKIDVSSLK